MSKNIIIIEYDVRNILLLLICNQRLLTK